MYPFSYDLKMFFNKLPVQYCCILLERHGRCHFVVECFDDIKTLFFFSSVNVIVRNTRNDNNVFDLGKMENKGFIELKVILRFLGEINESVVCDRMGGMKGLNLNLL